MRDWQEVIAVVQEGTARRPAAATNSAEAAVAENVTPPERPSEAPTPAVPADPFAVAN